MSDKSVENFERSYLAYLEVVHGLDYKLTKDRAHGVVDSLLTMLNARGITYTNYIITELDCVFDSECNGNPFDLDFSEKFKDKYSDKIEKLLLVDFLMWEKEPGEIVCDAIINNLEKLIDQYNIYPTNRIRFSLTLLMELVNRDNPKSIEVIRNLFNVVSEEHYEQDMGRAAASILVSLDCASAYQLAKELTMHPNEFLKEEMQAVVDYYEEKK